LGRFCPFGLDPKADVPAGRIAAELAVHRYYGDPGPQLALVSWVLRLVPPWGLWVFGLGLLAPGYYGAPYAYRRGYYYR
jgi:hypothetical protein